jgi:hypothetical protein
MLNNSTGLAATKYTVSVKMLTKICFKFEHHYGLLISRHNRMEIIGKIISGNDKNKYGFLNADCARNVFKTILSLVRNAYKVSLHLQLHCGPDIRQKGA